MEEIRYKRIAVTGDPGSGKSTFARLVAEYTGFRLITTGEMFRSIAKDMGVSITELNTRAEKQKDIDTKVDDFLKFLNDAKEDLVLDSRMAWHFIKGAFKIRMAVDPEIAAKRIFDDSGEFREEYPDIDTAIREVKMRKQSEVDRYMNLYGVDISEPDNFDLVLDTSYKSKEDIFSEFLEYYKEYETKF